MFLSQQLQAWLRLLNDEYWTNYKSAAAATDKFQPSLSWKRETIEDQLLFTKTRSLKLMRSSFVLRIHFIFQFFLNFSCLTHQSAASFHL
jgi:hypothetical protein